MIHVDSVTSALHSLLSSDGVLVSSGFTVVEGDVFNKDPNLTPWVGQYYGSLTVEPHTLGGNGPWKAGLEVLLYVQEASHRSGQEATRRLSQAQAAVLDVLNRNKTIGDAVLVLSSLAVAPFERELEKSTWLFTNEITIKAELRG
ncbi:MAG: hypothetical protein OEW12_05705 [Deltaproteobacteria bacterium]|nr:hypothetical protein [Deltaproteobacteria bacterium]